MANASIMVLPLALIHSTDKNRVIEFLVKLLKNSDARIPVYLAWSYINSVAIEAEDMEALVQLSEEDLSSASES